MKQILKLLLSKTGYRLENLKLPSHPVLNNLEYILGPKIDSDIVAQFIKSIRPYQTDKELIRMGCNSDGGYLIPDDLEGIEACYSPGICNMTAFEDACMKRGITVHMADKSVNKPSMGGNNDTFIKKHINSYNSSEYMTMNHWISETNKCQPHSDLLLQMDIEGAEYIVLSNMPETLINQFRIIVIEFHWLDRLWDKYFTPLIQNSFNKLLQTHTIVHIHPNNAEPIVELDNIDIPVLAEFTFLRNDRIKRKKLKTLIKHDKDFDNTSFPPIELSNLWHA